MYICITNGIIYGVTKVGQNGSRIMRAIDANLFELTHAKWTDISDQQSTTISTQETMKVNEAG